MKTRRKINKAIQRRGATLVEMAVTLPVFLLFLFALFEFSHAFMVANVLNAAAQKASRFGVTDGVSTSQVQARVNEILATAVDTGAVTVMVKDAGVFDAGTVDVDEIEYDDLPAIELSSAEPRQLFLVRVEVPYSSVAILTPKWITNITLSSQSVMRHE